ncbi:MAG: SpoIVB peptidase [Blautia sp.]
MRKCNYRRFLCVLLTADLIMTGVFGWQALKNVIPDTIYVQKDRKEEVAQILDIPFVTCQDTIKVSDANAYRVSCNLLGVFPLKEVKVETVKEKKLGICGLPVGFYMETQGVLIVDTGEIINMDGIPCEPAANIVKSGDYILEANGEAVQTKKELIEKINASNGNPVTLLVKREGEEIPVSIEPVMGQDTRYKLGVWVRDNTQGIGTLTYVEDDGSYGALGHGISDTDTGQLLEVSRGELYEARIVSVLKGSKGNPGELSGYIDYSLENKIGEIQTNTEKGVYGRMDAGCLSRLPISYRMVGYKQEVQIGEAQIWAGVDGKVQPYSARITDIFPDQADSNKAFSIQVTDSELLAKTGGIVQGMSGSPVVQNGKIIGAVTHVFVQDASRGYGIFIEKMLKE